MATNCTYIDGIGSSQTIDTAGEIVDLKGLDISSLVGSVFNWEHERKEPSQIVGKILEAKKIYSKEDCENDRHLLYWNRCQLPFLYVMGRLLDDKKASSKEVAALFKDDAEHPNEADMVGFSVEGSKVEKVGAVITRSIARKVTITQIPANKTCIAEMLPEKKDKNDIDSLFKGEMELFSFEPTYIEIMEKGKDLNKALEAGSAMVAPSQMVGGSVLVSESLEKPKKKKSKLFKKEKSPLYERADQAYGTWDKKNHFKSYMKKRMPHLAEGEVDAIGRVLALRKTLNAEKKLSKMYTKYSNLEKALIDEGKTPHQKARSRAQRNDRTVTTTSTFHPGKIGKLLGKKPDVRVNERSHSAGSPFVTASMPGHAPQGNERSTHTKKIVGTPAKSMTKTEDHIHGLPKGHPSLGEHKGHIYRRVAPPTPQSNHWSWAVRSPEGKDSKVHLPHDTAGSKESIHAHIDSMMPKK